MSCAVYICCPRRHSALLRGRSPRLRRPKAPPGRHRARRARSVLPPRRRRCAGGSRSPRVTSHRHDRGRRASPRRCAARRSGSAAVRSCRLPVTGATFVRMLRTRRRLGIRRVAAAALSLQFAAAFGLSVVEASHNHLDPDIVEWHGGTGGHPDDDQSAHAQCVLCGHGGVSTLVANRAVVVHAPAVHGVRAPLPANRRLAAADAGFPTRPRAPPVA